MVDIELDDKSVLDFEVDTKDQEDDDFNIDAYNKNRSKRRSMRRSFTSSASEKSSKLPAKKSKISKRRKEPETTASANLPSSSKTSAPKTAASDPAPPASTAHQPVHPRTELPAQPNKPPQPTAPANKHVKSDYKIWLQIVNDNKLAKHNPFQLKLIDYMTEMCTNTDNKNNFQFAGASVDAGARIYAKKVDSAYDDTFRVLKEVTLNQKKGNKQGKNLEPGMEENLENQEQNFDENGQPIPSQKSVKNGDLDQEADFDAPFDAENPENNKKKIAKKPRKKSSYIMSKEKEENMINKTKNSIINPNLRYQHLLSNSANTSIGDLNHMQIVKDLPHNDSNINQNLLKFFQEEPMVKNFHVNQNKSVPSRVMAAYKPVFSKMSSNSQIFKDNFCARFKGCFLKIFAISRTF